MPICIEIGSLIFEVYVDKLVRQTNEQTDGRGTGRGHASASLQCDSQYQRDEQCQRV